MNKIKAQAAEGLVSVIVNAVLFAAKMWAGMATGSIALIADAWHTLSDSLSSVFVIGAAKLSAKKADKEHPFGHGRWEPITSVFVAVLLCVVAYEFFKNSVVKFMNRETAVYGTLAVVVTAVSIAVKELLAQYAFYIARKTDNLVVKGDAWHHRSDALSSVVVLIGIILNMVFAGTWWWMDSLLGVIVAVMILYAAFVILKEAISTLLGEEPSLDLLENITQEVRKACGDNLQMHHFHLHNYIMHKELTLHIKLDKDMSIENGHKVASNIEQIIEEKFNIAATVHVEPLG